MKWSDNDVKAITYIFLRHIDRRSVRSRSDVLLYLRRENRQSGRKRQTKEVVILWNGEKIKALL